MDHHGEFKLMQTNEQGAIAASRRIPLSLDTALYEIFGNISSKSMISLKISDDFDFIYIFSEDKWDESDKKALHEKYSSGTFIKASHINGKGIKLTLDRILDETPAIYCIQGQDELYYTSKIGHYEYTEWREMNENEIEIYKSNIRNITNGEKSSGTYIKIPVNNEYKALLEKKDFNYCKKLFNKFFNRLPFIKQNVLLFNNEKQEFEPLCKNYIELDLDYDSLLLVKEYLNNCILNGDIYLDSLKDEELFKLANISNYLLMEKLLDNICIRIAKKICDNKTSDEIIDKYNLRDYLTDEEIEEIKNEELYNVN